MTQNLENASLQLSIDPIRATWSLFSRQWDGALLQDARSRLTYHRGRRRVRALERWLPLEIKQERSETSPHGPARSIDLEIGPDSAGIHCRLSFLLPLDHPLLLWRVSVANHGKQPITIDEIELLRVGYPAARKSSQDLPPAYPGKPPGSVYYRGLVQPHPKPGRLAFFSNGWASWSHTGLYSEEDRQKWSRLGFLRAPATMNSGSPRTRRRGHFISEMFGVLGNQTYRTAILAGFLSQETHFGALEAWAGPQNPSLRMWAQGDQARLDPGQAIETDWACLEFIHLDQPDPLGDYLEAVSRQHGLQEARSDIPVGWCSWYHYYEQISPEIIRANLEAARHLRPGTPLDLIQIDDGFSAKVGDWFDFQSNFPDGVTDLAAEIAGAGFTPGIWLAPFITLRGSRTARQHPDWLLRNRFGQPVNAGFNWNQLATALDLTNESALGYAVETVHNAVHKWGFPYLKLDFLYAAALPGQRRDPTKTRAQVLRSGLAALREAAGESTTLVGCGCPLGSAIGLVDAMRIGPDVAGEWEPHYRGIRFLFAKEPDAPSARNSLENSLSRAALHKRWWLNDPDCLLLRTDTSLTAAEVELMASVVALTGGSLVVSDDLASLPADRVEMLGRLLPPIGERPHTLDWFDGHIPARLQLDLSGPAGEWHLIGLFNWDEKPADLTLRVVDFYLDPRLEYYASSFWDGGIYRFAGEHTFLAVPAHGAAVIAVRPAGRIWPQYLGGNLHISQGLEVAGWDVQADRLQLRVQRPGSARGQVLLALPQQPSRASIDGIEITWTEEIPGVYRFRLEFHQAGTLDLTWG